jgi:hypothetical protein
MAKNLRPETIDHAPMRYAPTNEQGVVFLFSYLLKKYRLTVETVRTGYASVSFFWDSKADHNMGFAQSDALED